jgi:hypothetical protein
VGVSSGPFDERRVAGSLSFPFRGRRWAVRWLVGLLLLALLPLTFVVVFGYAVGCVRAAAADPAGPPPPLRIRRRLLADGAWSALQAGLLTLPFAAAAWWLGGTLVPVWHPMHDSFVDPAMAWVVAIAVLALPWGMLMLVLLPPTLARFAVTGRPADLASVPCVMDCIRHHFVAWNLVVGMVTTAWVLAAMGLALCVVGVVPVAFYAILVSAHACAALAPNQPAR